MRTIQEIFDQVATHLILQDQPSQYKDSCFYRNDKGNKCAIGCLISDEDYKSSFEHRSLIGLLEYPEFPQHLKIEFQQPDVLNLLLDLQVIHDERWIHRSFFLKELTTKYSQYNLKMPLVGDTHETN